jgi:hypothetical protein
MRQAQPAAVEAQYVSHTEALHIAQDMISQRIREIYKSAVTTP